MGPKKKKKREWVSVSKKYFVWPTWREQIFCRSNSQRERERENKLRLQILRKHHIREFLQSFFLFKIFPKNKHLFDISFQILEITFWSDKYVFLSQSASLRPKDLFFSWNKGQKTIKMIINSYNYHYHETDIKNLNPIVFITKLINKKKQFFF